MQRKKLEELPPVNDSHNYAKLRNLLRRVDRATNKSNLQQLYDRLYESGFVEGEMDIGRLTVGTKPFNVFARIQSRSLLQPPNDKVSWKGTEAECAKLGEYGDRFVVACNREENDQNWNSKDEAWVGKVTMRPCSPFRPTSFDRLQSCDRF